MFNLLSVAFPLSKHPIPNNTVFAPKTIGIGGDFIYPLNCEIKYFLGQGVI